MNLKYCGFASRDPGVEKLVVVGWEFFIIFSLLKRQIMYDVHLNEGIYDLTSEPKTLKTSQNVVIFTYRWKISQEFVIIVACAYAKKQLR